MTFHARFKKIIRTERIIDKTQVIKLRYRYVESKKTKSISTRYGIQFYLDKLRR